MFKGLFLSLCCLLLADYATADSNNTVPALVVWMMDEEKAVEVSAGGNNTCAITTSGKVKCWGANTWGQLGLGNASRKSLSTEPLETQSIKNVIELDSGNVYHCATLKTQSRKCWGRNEQGQFGNGTTIGSSIPRGVPSQPGVKDTVLGGNHSCALLNDGAIKCWGSNVLGGLGDGSRIIGTSAVNVIGISNAVNIDLGYTNSSCAVLSTGKVMCWGSNARGQLGNGTQVHSSLPVEVIDINNAISVSAGTQFSCALLSTGSIKCWGSNDDGKLGNGQPAVDTQTTPVTVVGINDAEAIYTGGSHACALLGSGRLKCWGDNSQGELGNGTFESSSTPVLVRGIEHPTSVSLGGSHSCVVSANSDIKCWGSNRFGQLGNLSIVDSSTAVTVVSF